MVKTFLKHNMQGALIAFAIFFCAIVIGYFVWGVGYLVMQLNEANNGGPSTGSVPGFDVAGAATIDYRGMPLPVVASSS